jgi:ADP-ribosyl-[dinitrogen reductase] hydrolase
VSPDQCLRCPHHWAYTQMIKDLKNSINFSLTFGKVSTRSIYKDVLLGIAVGDALGVPAEFKSRSFLKLKPVTTMTGYGTHNLPPGDSSLSFCLAEALLYPFSLFNIANNFQKWLNENYWTPRGYVFDVGITTRNAIYNMAHQPFLEEPGGRSENENGNGSLMRILPLIFYIKDKAIWQRYEFTRSVSSLTHAHPRSIIACFYYLEFARLLTLKTDKLEAYLKLQQELPVFFRTIRVDDLELGHFDRLLKHNIDELEEESILSTGYVVHTLEASIWCLLRSKNYQEAVLKAVNLGEDSDTTGAVTGGLAGILYGHSSIPRDWLSVLAKKEEIEDLAERLLRWYHYTEK